MLASRHESETLTARNSSRISVDMQEVKLIRGVPCRPFSDDDVGQLLGPRLTVVAHRPLSGQVPDGYAEERRAAALKRTAQNRRRSRERVRKALRELASGDPGEVFVMVRLKIHKLTSVTRALQFAALSSPGAVTAQCYIIDGSGDPSLFAVFRDGSRKTLRLSRRHGTAAQPSKCRLRLRPSDPAL